jgi:hypothetical protein
MESIYQIFKDGEVAFMRSDTVRRSKVNVKSEAGYNHRIYRFKKIPEPYQSPYISWANLNCCGGWTFDKSYLLTAVQEGKKLCAGITTTDETAFHAYLDNLSGEYPHFCPPPTHGWQCTNYHIDVTRKGCIGDYIDLGAVRETYLALEIDFLDFKIISEYANKPMIHLLDGTVDFDYVNPKSDEQCAVTGLLLGYPLESTAALLREAR